MRILKKYGLNKMIYVIFPPILAKLESVSLTFGDARLKGCPARG